MNIQREEQANVGQNKLLCSVPCGERSISVCFLLYFDLMSTNIFLEKKRGKSAVCKSY